MSYLEVQSLSKNKRIGLNFLSILNDIKRRPEDAAEELGVSTEEINQIIAGEKELKLNPSSRSAKLRYGIKLSDNFDFSEFIKKFNYLLEVEDFAKHI